MFMMLLNFLSSKILPNFSNAVFEGRNFLFLKKLKKQNLTDSIFRAVHQKMYEIKSFDEGLKKKG